MPTKQNVLCEEQSLWQVMETHPDFKRVGSLPATTTTESSSTDVLEEEEKSSPVNWMPSTKATPFFPPEFEYVLPSNGHRYVLVLDRTLSVSCCRGGTDECRMF
jgi:hypothetical protein